MTQAARNIVLLLASLLMLSACSTTFVYRQLDWMIPWYVNGLVDITREQKKQFKQYLEPALEWHREEELARYATLLNHVEADLQEAVSPAQIRGWVDEATAAVQRIEARFLDVSLELGESLTDEQMEEFRQGLWEEQAEFEEEFLPRSDEEYWEESLEYLVETTESFLGRLDEAQLSIYQESVRHLTRFDRIWLENRAEWLRRIEPLLQRPPGWQDALRQAHQLRETQHTAEYQRVYEENLAVLCQAIADVLNRRSEKQSKHLAKEMDDWQRKLQKMQEPG